MPEYHEPANHPSNRLLKPLQACARGELAPNVALMHLLIEARHPGEVEASLIAAIQETGASGSAPVDAALALWRRSPGAWEIVKSILAQADHRARETGSDGTAKWAAVFDRIAAISPEAGAALYSLGSPLLLEAATASLVDRLREWGLLGLVRTVLDLGCGAGRVTAALAPEVHAVAGIDVSGGMLAAARRRCAGLGNVLLAQTSGRDLSAFASSTFDLVLAVDTFPYLVLAGGGLTQIHLREAHRVLKPHGSLVLFNYSYGGDRMADIEALQRQAADAGFTPDRLGTCDLAWWDGVTYHVRRSN